MFLVGDNDSVVPVAKAEEFRDKIREFGGECELHIFPGGVHPLFNYRKNPGKMYYIMLYDMIVSKIRMGM